MKKKTLYRPVNKVELDLIQELNWKAFPPRLPEQPIFYPVTNQEYASQITREWNIPSFKNGFVTAFDLDQEYLSKFKVEKVGLDHHTELWVPAEELEEFNSKIIGPIRVIEGYVDETQMQFIQIVDSYDLLGVGQILVIKVLNSDTAFYQKADKFNIGNTELGQIENIKVNSETKEQLITFKIDESLKSNFHKSSIQLIHQIK